MKFQIKNNSNLIERFLVSFIIVLFLFLLTYNYQYPGLYFDEVNPDYSVANILGNANIAFCIPGNFIFNMIPILPQLYHGALPVYFDIPFIFLFGKTIFAVRIAHAFMGIAILLTVFFLMKKLCIKKIIRILILALIAFDPNFIFAFKTQFYIIIFPLTLIFLSFIFYLKSQDSENKKYIFFEVISGVFLGLSIYGYFIYIVFVPYAFYLRLSSKKKILPFIAGSCMGCLPYIIGYSLFFLKFNNLQEGFNNFVKTIITINTTQSDGFLYRISTGLKNLTSMIFNVNPIGYIYNSAFPIKYYQIRYIFIAFSFILLCVNGSKKIFIHLTIMILSLLLLIMVFGNRLASHHFIIFLPVYYVFTGILFNKKVEVKKKRSFIIILLLSITVLIVSMINLKNVINKLAGSNHGNRYFSYSINEFLDKYKDKPGVYFFPDWGLYLQFVLLKEDSVVATTGFTSYDFDKYLKYNDSVYVILFFENSRNRYNELKMLLSRINFKTKIVSDGMYLDGKGEKLFEIYKVEKIN